MTTSSSPTVSCSLQDEIRAVAEHQGRADGRGRVDRQREQVCRTVTSTRASTARSPCSRNRACSWSSRPNATITRSIEIASWTIDSDSPSIPLTCQQPLPDVL